MLQLAVPVNRLIEIKKSHALVFYRLNMRLCDELVKNDIIKLIEIDTADTGKSRQRYIDTDQLIININASGFIRHWRENIIQFQILEYLSVRRCNSFILILCFFLCSPDVDKRQPVFIHIFKYRVCFADPSRACYQYKIKRRFNNCLSIYIAVFIIV